MGKGYKHGGSGGANPLNFIVKAYPSEVEMNTSTAVANTIGVVTTNPITGWYFAAEQPENMTEGEVWFKTGTSSNVNFNALKQKSIMVCPLCAKQMVSNELKDVTAKSYQNGEWVDWNRYLYDSGNECTDITGGWVAGDSATINKATSEMSVKSNVDNGYRYLLTKNKIDVTPYKTLHAIAKIGTGGSSSDKGNIGVSENGTTTSGSTSFTNTEYQEVTYDLSSQDGLFYIRVGDQGDDSSTFVQKIWLT